MKTLLVLILAAAASARPEAGFAYSVVDPGQGYAADGTLAGLPVVPVTYQTGCRNNDGQAVPCAGESFTPPAAPVQRIESAPVVQAPVVQAPVAQAPAPVAPAETGIVSVKKREAVPAYYYSAINPAMYGYSPAMYSGFAAQPAIYANTAPLAYSPFAPVVYTPGPVGCRNDEGKVVACIGEPEPAPEAKMAEPKPEPTPAAKMTAPEPAPVRAEEKSAKPDESQTALEAAKAAAKIISIKKREADPSLYYYSNSPVLSPFAYNRYAQRMGKGINAPKSYAAPLLPFAGAPLPYAGTPLPVAGAPLPVATAPLAYAEGPMVYEPIGCRNNMGSVVPCAMGNRYSALPLPAAAPLAVAPAPVAVGVNQAVVASPDTIVSIKKREAESEAQTLYYADTFKYPGYAQRSSATAPVAVPTSYTVSDPIVTKVFTAAAVQAPVAGATTYVASSPIVAALQPGCRNEQGSLVPCA